MSDAKPAFTLQQIEKIADLAHLELTAAEKETFARQFAEILAYFRKIEKVPTDEVPAYTGVEGDPHLRPDAAEPASLSPDSFSPYLESGHFKVPRVIE